MRAALALLLLSAGSAWAGSTQPPVNASSFVTPSQLSAAIPPAYTDARAAAASPVQSVNGLTGNPVLPVYQRQVSTALAVSTADGSVAWTYPTPFKTAPTCYPTLNATTTTYTFDYPVEPPPTTTGVTASVTAHLKSMSIASLSLPIVLQLTPPGAPAGTTITFTCFAPA